MFRKASGDETRNPETGIPTPMNSGTSRPSSSSSKSSLTSPALYGPRPRRKWPDGSFSSVFSSRPDIPAMPLSTNDITSRWRDSSASRQIAE